MSFTDSALGFAVCTNVADCATARGGSRLEWYSGAGEYCPECGEALVAESVDAPAVEAPAPPAFDAGSASREAHTASTAKLRTVVPTRPPTANEANRGISDTRAATPRKRFGIWFWAAAAALIAGAIVVFITRRGGAVERVSAAGIRVCPMSSSEAFAADLVHGFAAKNGWPADRFRFGDANAGDCDVQFSTTAAAPEAVVARDGIVAVVNPLNPIARITEGQLRAIYSGAIRDWAQLGGAPGPITALMPDAGSDESKALASSLFFNMPIDRRVRRGGSSADVTRAVTGADRTSRVAIGLVAFSQAVTAKVLPLTYLPPPSVLSIASRRYPYTLSIALRSASRRAASTVASLLEFAHSNEGVAIVQKSGLVSPEGF